MKRYYYLLLMALLMAAVAACNAAGEETAVGDTQPTAIPAVDTPEPETAETADDITIGEAQVDAIDILLMESFPVQVSVQVNGFLSDGCTTLGDIETNQEGDTFQVIIATQRPAEGICSQQLMDFQENIALDVQGLSAGTYHVDVNGVSGTFTLDVDNTQSDETAGITLPDAELVELIRLTLERALVAREIPDYESLTAGREEIILSSENINADWVPSLADVNLVVLTPEEIQAKANEEGDFLYLKFEEVTAVSDTTATVSLNHIWMRVENSEMVHRGGGGFVIEYSQTADGWQGEMISSWIS